MESIHTITFLLLSIIMGLFSLTFSESSHRLFLDDFCKRDRRDADDSGAIRVKIAVLLPFSDHRLFSVHRVMPAIELALEYVNRTNLLPVNVSLTVKAANSRCSNEAINEAFNFYLTKEVSVYLGPVCDYAVAPIARQMRYWQLPIITAGAMAGDFGRYKSTTFPLLTRTGPHFNSLANFILTTMAHFSWRKVKLVYYPDAQAHIVDRFCHLAADGMHHALLRQSMTNHSIKHDYFKIVKLSSQLNQILTTEIANEYAGQFKSYPFFFTTVINYLLLDTALLCSSLMAKQMCDSKCLL